MESSSLIANLVPTLYEDDLMLAVVKPAGIDAGDARDGAAPGLVELLGDTFRDGLPKLHACNRLSRYESGILVLAKSRMAADRIRAQLRDGKVQCEYVVRVRGRLAGPRTVLGNSDHSVAARSSKRLATRRTSDRPVKQRRVGVEKSNTVLTPLRAHRDISLVRCLTHAENTHVLRAQFRAADLRIVGDALHDRSFRPKSPQDTYLHLARFNCQDPPLRLYSPPPDAFSRTIEGGSDWQRAIHAGMVRRLRCLGEPELDCIRLLTGDAEDLPGLVAEQFGRVLVLQVTEAWSGDHDELIKIARWYRRLLSAQAVYVKYMDRPEPHLTKTTDATPGASDSAVLIWGTPIREPMVVVERGLRFAVRPCDTSVGLFLDQRENRSRLRAIASGQQVLNLFAYTCGFSVASATGGASQTVSVDVSTKHLDWGRANFALNGLDADAHQFIRADSAEYVERALKAGRRFDILVIDPPTFAHGRRGKRRFSIVTDLSKLIGSAVELLNPGGTLVLSTNFRRLSRKALLDRLKEGARGRAFSIQSTPALPDDFAMDRDHAKTVIARFA